MVAFDFHPRFVKFVEDGRKTRTIRSKQRCKPGDTVQLYTNQRRTTCRKLGEGVCTGVYWVKIMPNYLEILQVGDNPVDRYRYAHALFMDDFAKTLGFGSWASLNTFYEGLYGPLPFEGYLHIWELDKPKKPAKKAAAKKKK